MLSLALPFSTQDLFCPCRENSQECDTRPSRSDPRHNRLAVRGQSSYGRAGDVDARRRSVERQQRRLLVWVDVERAERPKSRVVTERDTAGIRGVTAYAGG